LAGDQELVAPVEALDVAGVGRAIRLLVPAVAPGARQHEIPDAIDGCPADRRADGPGKEMVDLAEVWWLADVEIGAKQ
jgi:hypothetical protein